MHFFILTAPGSQGHTYDIDGIINTSEWYHVAGTYDGQTIKLYIDGNLIDSSVRITKNYSAQNNYQVYDDELIYPAFSVLQQIQEID